MPVLFTETYHQNVQKYIGVCPLRAGMIESEEMSVTRLWHSKQHSGEANFVHATMEELWREELFVGYAQILHLKN
jgi:hypothetical protein